MARQWCATANEVAPLQPVTYGRAHGRRKARGMQVDALGAVAVHADYEWVAPLAGPANVYRAIGHLVALSVVNPNQNRQPRYRWQIRKYASTFGSRLETTRA